MLREKREECVPNSDPLARPDYTEADVQAIRACYNGTATPDQQRAALDWMIQAFGTHDLSFRPDNQYLSAFAEGRRHAGTTIVWMIRSALTKTDPDKISARSAGEENARPDNRN